MIRVGPQRQRREKKKEFLEIVTNSRQRRNYCGSNCSDFSVNSNKDTFSEVSLKGYSVMLKTC